MTSGAMHDMMNGGNSGSVDLLPESGIASRITQGDQVPDAWKDAVYGQCSYSAHFGSWRDGVRRMPLGGVRE